MPVNKSNHQRKATLKDIAKTSNVSATTVSLVLNDPETPRVGLEKRKRILEIANKVDYRPNYTARSLVGREGHTLGLVITTLANPFYAEISKDIIIRAKETGYSVVISSVRGDIEDERRSVNDLLDRGVDGLIICSALRKDIVIQDLFKQRIPFVLALRSVETRPGDPPSDCIVIDNERGGYLAVEHLLKMDHQNIGILTGDQNTSTGYDRVVGAMAAFEDYGVDKKSIQIMNGDFKRKTGYRLTRQLLEKKDIPTAIFAHNDHMAIGVLDAVREKGMKIPDDIALIGFDDIEMAGVPGVDLTTVSQKKSTMGKMAVDTIIDKITGRNEHIAKRITLDPIFIIRNSCGFVSAGEKYVTTKEQCI
jgi:LacI family transcriptional regulator, galactose operon repressor